MRKPLGILILVIGIVIVGFCLYDISTDHDIHDQSDFYVGLVVGFILSIIGIIMISSHKKKEAERLELKKILTTNATQSAQSNPSVVDDKLAQLEKLGKLKEQGLLTEEEFQEQKKRLLS